MGWREKSRLLVFISSVSVILIGFVLANRPLSDSLHSASSNSRSNRILFPENTVDLAKASQNPLKNLLNLLTKNRGSHSGNATSLLNQLLANDGNSTSVNNTLAYLYRLGNETNYFKNLTALQEIMNRTSRGYGGGGWGGMGGGYGGGGGIDPTLFLLLGDNNRNRGHEYPYYPPPYNMNNNNNNNMEKLSFGELALLTLLGLALISRFPTQG